MHVILVIDDDDYETEEEIDSEDEENLTQCDVCHKQFSDNASFKIHDRKEHWKSLQMVRYGQEIDNLIYFNYKCE